MTEDPRSVILALAEHEEAMSALYSAYADAYPDVAGLWTALARDEHGHGAMLRSLVDGDVDVASFAADRGFDLADIRADTARLANMARITPAAGFPLQEAFRVAIKLEDSLIESQVLVVYDNDPPEVVKVLDTLRDQTEKHRHRLSERFTTLGA